MNGRRLGGDLEHLGLEALFRLIEASGAHGRLEIRRPEGTAVLEVAGGRVRPPGREAMRVLAGAARDGRGEFRLEVDPELVVGPEGVELAALLAAASSGERGRLGSDRDVEELLAEELAGVAGIGVAPVHHLAAEVAEDPLADLVDDLVSAAPEELSLAAVAVVASDPRPWRGGAEVRWRRRGWELRLYATPGDVPLEATDVLVVHHSLSITRVGREDDWLELLRRARAADPPRPVVWIGPLGDPRWVQRLVGEGVSFLLPPPAAVSGEPLERFLETVGAVVEEQLQRIRWADAEPAALSQVLDALLSGAPAEEALAALLQVAARRLRRAAIIEVTSTAFRFRATVGYRPEPGHGALPRGIALLERVARGGEVVRELDPEAAGAPRVAEALGVERLPAATCLLPMVHHGRVTGVLLGDREGEAIPPLDEVERLARPMGRLFARR